MKALAFSGAMASGKSSLSTAVAAAFGWPRVTFGDYVRSEATQRGLSWTREALEELGERLIEEQDFKGFCLACLDQVSWRPGEPIIVDGVRHPEALEALRSLVSPAQLPLIYIDLARERQLARLADRGVLPATAQRHAQHSTEARVGTSLRDLAALIVDGEHPIDQLTTEIAVWMRRH